MHRVEWQGQTYFVSDDAFALAEMALEDEGGSVGLVGETNAIRTLRDSFGMTLLQAKVATLAVRTVKRKKTDANLAK